MDIKIKNYIRLDFSPLYHNTPKVFAKQGDDNTRFIVVTPLLSGRPYDIDQTGAVKPYFAAFKPDGKYVYNDLVEIRDDGSLLVELSDQTLAVDGEVTCCIVLVNDADDLTLTSQNFIVDVEYSAGAYKNLVSSDEIMGFNELISRADAKLTDIDKSLDAWETKAQASLDEIEKIYKSLAALFPVASPKDDGMVPVVIDGAWAKRMMQARDIVVDADGKRLDQALEELKESAGTGQPVYVIGEPVDFYLDPSKWNGTTYTLDITGYTISDPPQIGLPTVSSYANTNAVVQAAMTIPEASGTTVIISAVTAPTVGVYVAIFGLAVAAENAQEAAE